MSDNCKDCGAILTDEDRFYRICDPCAFDKWEAEQPEREQRAREKLDAEGYYDHLSFDGESR